MKIKLTPKDVFGRILAYPADELSKRLAESFKVKAFTSNQVAALRAIGIAVVLVAQEMGEAK